MNDLNQTLHQRMRGHKAQGSTEYLVILGAVLTVALVMISILGAFPSSGSTSREQQSDAYWAGTTPFSIVNFKLTPNTISLQVKNTQNKIVRLTSIDAQDSTGNLYPIYSTATTLSAGQELAIADQEFITGNPCAGKTVGQQYEITKIVFTYSDGSINTIKQSSDKPLVARCAAAYADAMISGWVRDASSNVVPGATVILANATGTPSNTTNASGYYQVSVAMVSASGAFSITASANASYNTTSAIISASAGQQSSVDFTLGFSNATLSGWVRDGSGNGLDGTTVTLTNASGTPSNTTNSSGYYYFNIGMPAIWTVFSLSATKNSTYLTSTANAAVPAGVAATNDFVLSFSPVNGICGANNSQNLSTAPSTDLCSVGTPSAVSGTGPWNWTCNGTYGGTNASCSAELLRVMPTIVTNITVASWSWDIAITPNGAYVTNSGSNTVSVINTATNAVVANISVGTSPRGIAITPNGAYAYVTNSGSNTVSVINTATNAVIANISVGAYPNDVAITPDGAYAYVTNSGSNTVSVINTTSNTVVTNITVGNQPAGVALSPSGEYAYVVNSGFNSVSVISTATNTVVKTITVGNQPAGVAFAPNGAYAYVGIMINGIKVINTTTNAVVTSITLNIGSTTTAFTPNGAYAYVANSDTSTVSVINTATNTIVYNITVGATLRNVAVTPNGTYAYVVKSGIPSMVSVIDTGSYR